MGHAGMQLHLMLKSSEMSLRKGNLSDALHGYKTALDHCWSWNPILENAVQYILSKCSYIHNELKDTAAALNAALVCIERGECWAEVSNI